MINKNLGKRCIATGFPFAALHHKLDYSHDFSNVNYIDALQQKIFRQ